MLDGFPHYRFDDFLLEPREGRLTRAGQAVPVEPKSLEVLAYLLRHAGHLVRKEEVLEAVWPDVVVTENALTKAVARLRIALGDDAREPRFITTVPTLGYRFVAEVGVIEEAVGEASTSTAPETMRRAVGGASDPAGSSRGRRLIGGRGAALVAVVAVAVLVLLASGTWRLYAWSRHGSDPAAGSGTGAPGRIVVLPFENLGAGEQAYFVSGMHEALLENLTRVAGLRVISRTTALRYRDLRASAPEIAAELDADYLVEGAVLRDADRIRISAQLIDGSSDEHLWAESYDRRADDALAVLSEVARAIALQVEITLTPEQESLLSARSVDPAVQEAYLRARNELYGFTPEGYERAAALYGDAIALDPGFAPAHAGLAGAHVAMAIFGGATRAEALPRAREAAHRALELDPRLDDAFAALGFVELYFDRDWGGAAEHFRRAIVLDPCDHATRHGMADYLTLTGRPDEAVEHVRIGRQCDPFALMAGVPVVGHLFFARRYEEALRESERLRRAHPQFANSFRGRALWHLGREAEAVTALRESLPVAMRDVLDRDFRDAGPRGALRAVAEALVARVGEAGAEADALEIAMYYSLAGDVDAALTWLARAERDREPLVPIFVAASPDFDGLRDNTRFRDLARRIGLPEAGPRTEG